MQYVAVTAAALILAAPPAHAQDEGGGVLSITLQAALSLLALVVTAVIPVLTLKLRQVLAKRLELDQDELNNLLGERLDSALKHAIDYAVVQLNDKLKKANPGPLDHRREVVTTAAAYAHRHIPDTLRFFGLTPQEVQELVAARLPAAGVDLFKKDIEKGG